MDRHIRCAKNGAQLSSRDHQLPHDVSWWNDAFKLSVGRSWAAVAANPFFQTAATWVFAALNFRGIKLDRVLLCALWAETALSGKYYIVTALREEKGTFLDLVKTTIMGICEPVLVSACKHRLWKQHIFGNRGVELCASASHCAFNIYTRENSPSVGQLFLRLRIFDTETTSTILNLTTTLRKCSNPDA